MNFTSPFWFHYLETKSSIFCPILRALFALAFFMGTLSWSQPSYMVADFNHDTPIVRHVAYSHFHMLGDRFVFITADSFDEKALFISDGTQLGTERITAYSIYEVDSYLPLGNQLLFTYISYPETNPRFHLDVTDGTLSGTAPFRPHPDWPEETSEYRLQKYGTYAVFQADDELWISDGSEPGTRRIFEGAIKDLVCSTDGVLFQIDNDNLYFISDVLSSNPMEISQGLNTDLVAFNHGYIYIKWLSANTPQLTFTDGSSGGTEVLSDLEQGSPVQAMQFIGTSQDHLYFVCSLENSDQMLWKTDGTDLGTVSLTNLNPDQKPTVFHNYFLAGNRVFFQGPQGQSGSELWVADEQGARLVRDLEPGALSSSPQDFFQVNGTVFFTAETSSEGRELWRTDGSEAGTSIVMDMFPGPQDSKLKGFTAFQNDLYVYGITSESECGIWKVETDDFSVHAIAEGSYASNNTQIMLEPGSIEFENALFFGFWDQEIGPELWKTEGSQATTRSVFDFYEPMNINPSFSHHVWDWHDKLFVSAYVNDDYEINTFKVGIEPHSEIVVFTNRWYQFFPEEHQSYFTSSRGFYQTDGTLEGTLLFSSEIRRSTNTTFLGETFPALFDDFFYYHDLLKVYKIGRSQSEPTIAWEPPTYPYYYTILRQVKVGDRLFIFYRSPLEPEGYRLGCLDLNGHFQDLTSTDQYLGRYDHDLVHWPINGMLLFTFYDDTLGLALGVSDGTTEGTHLLADVRMGTRRPVTYQNKLFFNGTDDRGEELWCSDGSTSGTYMVKDINPNGSSGPAQTPVIVGDKLFFSADDGVHGFELWVSDGTETGTALVKDINSGHLSSSPRDLVAWGDKLYFVALDMEHGEELWCSDGTAQGTILIEDLIPGPTSGQVYNLHVAGETLYYYGFCGPSGIELRAWRPVPIPGFETVLNACQNTMTKSAVALEPNTSANFQWQLTGATLLAGQGTRLITFQVDHPSQVDIQLVTTIGDQSTLALQSIPVVAQAPSQPEIINGDMLVCQGDQAIQYDTPPVEGATSYSWSVPAGSNIVSGQGSSSIQVDFGDQAGYISVIASNDCGSGPAQELAVNFHSTNAPAFAGQDQIVCGMETTLDANTVESMTGTWQVLQGNSGVFDDLHDPKTRFSGLRGESYVLEWQVQHGPCGQSSSSVFIRFMPEWAPADAGPDVFSCDLEIQLNANHPAFSQGRWEIVEGNDGQFSQLSDPHALFWGQEGETYTLRWTLWNDPCPFSQDEVLVSFIEAIPANAGPDQCSELGQVVALEAQGSPGYWSVASGPDTSNSQFVDFSQPNTLFSATGGPGAYELEWHATPSSCDSTTDRMIVQVFDSAMTSQTVFSSPHISEGGDVGPRNVGSNFTIGDITYFAAEGSYAGEELWRSDGTLEGTYLFRNFNLGSGSSHPEPVLTLDPYLIVSFSTASGNRLVSYNLQNDQAETLIEGSIIFLTRFPGGLIFVFNDDEGHVQLWRSNGTESGTNLVTYLPQVNTTSNPYLRLIGQLPDGVVFSFDREIWYTNGDPNGTYPIMELSYDYGITAQGRFGQNLLFSKNGHGLYKTDGTNAGTVPIITSVMPLNVTEFSGQILFSASHDDLGTELWKSDGSEAGTQLIKDIHTGAASSNPAFLIELENEVYVQASDNEGPGLWRTDGTEIGTTKVIQGSFEKAVVFENQLILYRSEPAGLWISDGSAAGTQLFFEGQATLWDVIDGSVLFRNETGRLFRTDGTSEGTQLIVPLSAHHYSSNNEDENHILALDSHVLWNAHDTLSYRKDIWASDGSPEGTELLMEDISGFQMRPSSNDSAFISVDTTIWQTDGTVQGTIPYLELSSLGLTHCQGMQPRGNHLFFASNSRLWFSEGTLATTNQLNSSFTTLQSNQTCLSGDFLFFTTSSGGIWKSDGTESGTTEIFQSEDDVRYLLPMENGQGVVFSTYSHGEYALWRTDGTPEGTFQLSDGLSSDPPFSSGHNVFFIKGYDELWVSDGSLEGTQFLVEMSTAPNYAKAPDGGVFFTGHDSASSELWLSDGTPQGTYQIYGADPFVGFESTIKGLTSLNGSPFIVANYQDQGQQLIGYEAGCTWLVGEPTPVKDHFLLKSIVPFGDKIAILKKDQKNRASLVTIRPSIPVPRDPHLRDLLLQYDTNSDSVVDQLEMVEATDLDLSHHAIADLDGLEHYTQITQLDLSYNQLESVVPLLALVERHDSHLEHVNLEHNLLASDDCLDLIALGSQLEGKAQLSFREQAGILYRPSPHEWPGYSILELLSGQWLPPYTLECGGAK